MGEHALYSFVFAQHRQASLAVLTQLLHTSSEFVSPVTATGHASMERILSYMDYAKYRTLTPFLHGELLARIEPCLCWTLSNKTPGCWRRHGNVALFQCEFRCPLCHWMVKSVKSVHDRTWSWINTHLHPWSPICGQCDLRK
jgi:hypothetical protein